MQGQRSSVSALPENISFEHGSVSTNPGVDPQLSWNSMQTSGQTLLPDYRISSGETNIPYLQHVRKEAQNAEWSLGESSYSASQRGRQNERKPEHAWSSRAAFTLSEQQYGPPNVPSLDNVDINPSSNHTTNNLFLLPNSGSNALPQDLNMSLEFGDQVIDDCEIIEHPTAYVSVGPSISFSGPSGCSGYVMDEGDGRTDCSLGGRRMSCKRKALEGHMGQSSGVGSSNSFRIAGRNRWHTLPAAQLAVSNTNVPMPIENDLINNRPGQANLRVRLDAGGAVSPDPFSLTAPSGNVIVPHRNFHVCVNGLDQDPMADNPFTVGGSGDAEVQPSRQSPRLVLCNHVFELNPSPAAENINLHRQPVGVPTTRASSSSSPAISEERNLTINEDPTSRHIPRSFSQHPVFIPASEMENTSQDPVNWNSTGVNPGTGNVAPAPRMGPGTRASFSSQRSCPQYPGRLSGMVRRSLLSATEPGGMSSTHAAQPNSPIASPEMAIPSGLDNHGTRASSSSPGWSRRSCPQYPGRLSGIIRRSLLSSTESGGMSGIHAAQSNSSVASPVMAMPSGLDNHGTRASSSSPGLSQRSCPQYPGRLSGVVRRSLLSSESGGMSSNHAAQSNSSFATPEMAFPSGLDNHRRRAPSSRAALLDRHFGGSSRTPYSLRTLAASSEGRSGIMSEQIRHVLDLMRRGERLRLEDMMILDHPVLFGMADIHDRHRDMRMDVDNMSYEELLALEERIGSVCTGLTEENIMSRLKQQKFLNTKPANELETEPCSICREEYNVGENIGILECGHSFHTGCIKQWLVIKNLCPICKATGLTT